MITKLDLSKGNLLAFKLSGEIHDEGIKIFTTDLKAALEEYDKVRLYLEFERFSGWDSVAAFEETMKTKALALGKIEKYAVVTDKQWLQKSAPLADLVTPRYPIRVFEMEKREEAIEWIEAPVPEPELSVEVLPLTVEGIVGFSIRGKLDVADYEVIDTVLKQRVEIEPELKVYIEIEEWKGWTLGGLWEDFKTGVEYYRHIKKAAIVTAEPWMGPATAIGNLLTPGMDLKTFTPTEKESAMTWLQA